MYENIHFDKKTDRPNIRLVDRIRGLILRRMSRPTDR